MGLLTEFFAAFFHVLFGKGNACVEIDSLLNAQADGPSMLAGEKGV